MAMMIDVKILDSVHMAHIRTSNIHTIYSHIQQSMPVAGLYYHMDIGQFDSYLNPECVMTFPFKDILDEAVAQIVLFRSSSN